MLSSFKKLKENKNLRNLRNLLILFFHWLEYKFNNKNFKGKKINFIVEKANWAIRWDGIYITNSINKFIEKGVAIISTFPLINSDNKVIHFASQYMWLDWHKFLSKNNSFLESYLGKVYR